MSRACKTLTKTPQLAQVVHQPAVCRIIATRITTRFLAATYIFTAQRGSVQSAPSRQLTITFGSGSNRAGMQFAEGQFGEKSNQAGNQAGNQTGKQTGKQAA